MAMNDNIQLAENTQGKNQQSKRNKNALYVSCSRCQSDAGTYP